MTYVLIDTNRTQDYVFASRRLFGIRNASRLLAAADRAVGRYAARKGTCIRAVGGVVVARFDGEDGGREATAFVKRAREAYGRIGVGVEAASLERTDPPGDFYVDVMLPLLTDVRLQKDSPSRADCGNLSSVLCVPCESSGLGPAERVIKLGSQAPRVTAAEARKWKTRHKDDEAAEAIATAIRAKLGIERSIPCAGTFEEIVGWKTGPEGGGVPEGAEGRQVGMVFADVNGLGRLLKHVARSEGVFAKFSSGLKATLVEVLAAAAAESMTPALERRCDRPGLAIPLRPVYVGGDDLCVAVAAPFAMAFVESLLRGFEEKSADLLKRSDGETSLPAFLTLSAGVVIAPFDYPILWVRRLGRDLEGRAKRVGRYFAGLATQRRPPGAQEDTSRPPTLPSLVDFHVVKNSALGGIGVARQTTVSTNAAMQVEWFGGPYLGGRDPEAADPDRTFVRLDRLRDAAQRIGQAGGPLPRGKMADLRSLIGAGLQQHAYTDWVAHLSKPASNAWKEVCNLLDVAAPDRGLPIRTRLPRSSAVVDAMDLARLESVRSRWEA